MGKRLEPRTYVLEFGEGTYLEGSTIRLRATPIEVTEQLESMSFVQSLPVFLEYLIEWDIEVEKEPDSGVYIPLECTVEAVRGHLEWPVLKAIIREWYRAAVGISAPLDPPSGDGPPSPDTESMEQSIEMAPL